MVMDGEKKILAFELLGSFTCKDARQEPQPPQEAEQQTEVQAQRTLDSPEELVLTPEPIYKKPPTGKSR